MGDVCTQGSWFKRGPIGKEGQWIPKSVESRLEPWGQRVATHAFVSGLNLSYYCHYSRVEG